MRSRTACTTCKANEGMVSVGVTNETSEFAVNSIRAWWQHLGQARYPTPRR